MMFVGTMDAENAHDRVAGIKKVIGDKIQVVDIRTDEADFARAKRNVEDALAKYSDIDLMVGLWSYEAPQIYNAVKGAGKAGKVKIIGFHEDKQTLRGIADGTIISTVVQQPYEFGYQSMTDMVKYLGGDKSWIPENKQIIIATKVIDSSNVKDFQATMKTLLTGK